LPEQNRIVIAANFTADPIAETLHFWIRRFGWADDIVFAPYNQVFQTLLDPNGAFAANPEAAHVLLLRSDRVGSEADLRSAIASFGKPVLVAYCPGPTSGPDPAPNELRLDALQALYPVAEPFDPHSEQLGDVPYTPQYFAALGTVVARALHARRMRPFKVIALDCDNTLWNGTCGEDGPLGVQLDEPRRFLQTFMREQREAGMLLAIASKNNEADVVETFSVHPEMPLRLDDFIARRINWDSKALGLTSIAEELSLGLDSFLLIDDSPKEIAEAAAGCPEVLGLELPQNPARIPHFLEHVWAFDHLKVTEEDRLRNASYVQQLERGRLERQTGNLEEFLRELKLEVHLQPASGAQIPRVAQLTQRTNQMNTTLLRKTEQEVRDSECWTVDVSDRFGSYGLVGAMFFSSDGDALVIDALLLSCRALGRGVEYRMLARAGELALENGLQTVRVPIVKGPRNQPAQDLVGGLPAPLTARECAELKPRSAGSTPVASREAIVADPTSGSGRIDYAAIARDLNNPSQILEAVRAEKRSRAAERSSTQQPRTDLERQLAALWAEALQVSAPGIHEDFFDLGGHSLLAVQLFSSVRQELGVELSMDLVYTGKLTISGMAAAVELAQADPEEMDRLMAEIDNLSEEELRALLAEE